MFSVLALGAKWEEKKWAFRDVVGLGALRKAPLPQERHKMQAESLVASRSFTAEALEANRWQLMLAFTPSRCAMGTCDGWGLVAVTARYFREECGTKIGFLGGG